MGCGRNVGGGALGEADTHGEPPSRGGQERQAAGLAPQTLQLWKLLPYFPISSDNPEFCQTNNPEAHTYMLELSKHILWDAKLVELWLDSADDIVYHGSVYGRLNENTGVNTTPTTTNSGSVSSSPLFY